VAKWAKFLQVSRSGYYEHLSQRTERQKKENTLKDDVRKLFAASGGTYGPDRICGVLRNQGKRASYRKISRLMAMMGLSSIHNRHRTRSLTNSKKARGAGYPNLVRGNTFTKPYQVVCSDITYIRTGEGWLYLCVVKDIVSGEILGEATSENMKKELVVRAFLNAQARHHMPTGIIFHSDRGSQYTSKQFVETLEQYGVRQSFSRVGMPGDNAWAESFFATLKKECVHWRHFSTRSEARGITFAWIEGFYNTKRVQAKLGYRSPKEFANSHYYYNKKLIA